MKVYLNSINKYQGNKINHTNNLEKQEIKGNKIRKFDELIIQSSPRQIKERTMVDSMAKAAVSEVHVTKSEGELEELKNKIAEGTYTVDVSAIASKILFGRVND